ncbi:hypothetical protein [Endozoicomonas sp.]|uniref:hypothetical protein n=1 Tax=Endozoicomonas sp. TaxID=1892382 RepID=UPI002888387E|nr:hypothetical protein [Endozoicomonas sp.]
MLREVSNATRRQAVDDEEVTRGRKGIAFSRDVGSVASKEWPIKKFAGNAERLIPSSLPVDVEGRPIVTRRSASNHCQTRHAGNYAGNQNGSRVDVSRSSSQLASQVPMKKKSSQSRKRAHGPDSAALPVKKEKPEIVCKTLIEEGFSCPVANCNSGDNTHKVLSSARNWWDHLVSAHGNGYSLGTKDKKGGGGRGKEPSKISSLHSLGVTALAQQGLIECRVAKCKNTTKFLNFFALGKHVLVQHKDRLDRQAFNAFWKEKLNAGLERQKELFDLSAPDEDMIWCRDETCGFFIDLSNDQNECNSLLQHLKEHQVKIQGINLGPISAKPISTLSPSGAGKRYQTRHGGGFACKQHPGEISGQTPEALGHHWNEVHLYKKVFCPVSCCFDSEKKPMEFASPRKLFDHHLQEHVVPLYASLRVNAESKNMSDEDLHRVILSDGWVEKSQLDFDHW